MKPELQEVNALFDEYYEAIILDDEFLLGVLFEYGQLTKLIKPGKTYEMTSDYEFFRLAEHLKWSVMKSMSNSLKKPSPRQ